MLMKLLIELSLKVINTPAHVLLCGYHGDTVSHTDTKVISHNYTIRASYTPNLTLITQMVNFVTK